MLSRRLIRLAVLVLLIVSATVGALMSPGLRHRHAGGTQPHSHANDPVSKANDTSHRHSHPDRHTHHHGHRHAQGHSHPHAAGSHHSHDEAVPQSTPHREHADAEQHSHPDDSASHIHVWLLGGELTLPDWSGDDAPEVALVEGSEAEAEAAPAGGQRKRSSDSDQFVEIRGPSLAGELVRLVLDFRALPAARYVLPGSRWRSNRRAVLDDTPAGRDRPSPPSPPPEIQA